MNKIILLICLFITGVASAQVDSLPQNNFRLYDTVVITALSGQSLRNIPYSIQRIDPSTLHLTPRTQLMQHLSLLPSMSAITQGAGINKPVIRGLSFNHIQLFSQGMRSDNQTWDDRHDIGIPDIGFDKIAIIQGPAALLYGPNSSGGAILFDESAPSVGEHNGYGQLTFFGNSMGGNLKLGVRSGTKDFYYSVHSEVESHANYVQGGGKVLDTSDNIERKPLAFNSKFTNAAFKGMIGVRKEKREHQLNVSLYKQMLGIIEDESLEAVNNPTKKEERDYEMEAPYQDVMTSLISTENIFKVNAGEIVFNAGYQFNNRKEFEPDSLPKSKVLGVGLDLQTVTADLQLKSGDKKAAGFTAGIQAFYQDNKNKGNLVLVPDAHITTVGAYLLGHWNLSRFNLLAGMRVDQHQMKTFETLQKEPDTIQLPVTRPGQKLTKNYTPAAFSVGVAFHPTENTTIKLNVANGYSAPNYAQLTSYGRHEGTFRFEVGNNNLEMEKNIQGDLIFSWEGKEISASVNGYYNHINNYIFLNPTSISAGSLKVYEWTQHDANIKGVELTLGIHPSTATWFEGSISGGVARGELTDGEGNLPNIPAAKLITAATFKKNSFGNWQNGYATLQLNAFAEQNKTATYETSTDGYALTDIFIGAVPPLGRNHRWTVSAFCTNLFNIAYMNHLSLTKSINVYEPGRNVGVQLRYDL
jgi:iron complex outermembrane recepter protein